MPLRRLKISISCAYFSAVKTTSDFFNRIGCYLSVVTTAPVGQVESKRLSRQNSIIPALNRDSLLKEGQGKLDDACDLRIRMMASVIACAFVSSVSMAIIALSATPPTPLSESYLVTSSMAADKACWLCRSNVSASAVAMSASELSDMAIVLE